MWTACEQWPFFSAWPSMTFGFAKLFTLYNALYRTKILWGMQLFGMAAALQLSTAFCVKIPQSSFQWALVPSRIKCPRVAHSASARKYPKRNEPVAFWDKEDWRLSPYCLIPQIHWSRKQQTLWLNRQILNNYTGNRLIILDEVVADRAAFTRPSLAVSVGFNPAKYGSLSEPQLVPIQTL